jgi:hypothetical protein
LLLDCLLNSWFAGQPRLPIKHSVRRLPTTDTYLVSRLSTQVFAKPENAVRPVEEDVGDTLYAHRNSARRLLVLLDHRGQRLERRGNGSQTVLHLVKALYCLFGSSA